MPTIDLATILAPLPGDNPAGVDMRYQPLYDEIKEARRADDLLDRGDWSRELKVADWDKVQSLALEALTNTTKDLQIAAWLLESLIQKEGFAGVETGLAIISGLLENFWENLYPEIDDGDLEYRCGPLEFINNKLAAPLKEIPLTDRRTTPGYAWFHWQEAVGVGREADVLDQWGNTDYTKKDARDRLIAEGKLSMEAFEAAVATSSKEYFAQLIQVITACQEAFIRLDALIDEKFGREAPRISDFKASLDDCAQQVTKILKEKRRLEPDPTDEPEPPPLPESEGITPPEQQAPVHSGGAGVVPSAATPASTMVLAVPAGAVGVNRLLGSGGFEEARWQEAQEKLQQSGIHAAVELLLGAACSAQSPREQANYHLLIAKICLQAQRPDLARPLAQQLFTQMEDLQLVRWESPIWIAEVLDLLYRCLTAEGASDDDRYRAKDILQRLCITDVTKALKHQLNP